MLIIKKDRAMEYDKNSEVYSKVVRAGKRTYFFDVKSTKGNDLYLTLTESKKTTVDGRESYQKHKLFLYKEDFEKFQDGLADALTKIDELVSTGEFRQGNSNEKNTSTIDNTAEEFTEVSFEDL
ncbi:MAG: DUF3276 family protein [Crocinitomicaceae bacterium]|nr:DUF3276 family protein [Crocinitomicaceae bacterium]MDG1657430.1 DUF3276 family protein [Crocinitomicaceae bacterium]